RMKAASPLRISLRNSLEKLQDRRRHPFVPTHTTPEPVSYFTVVLGNPPYAESSENRSDWIHGLMEDYKTTIRTEEAQLKTVSNDYVKFLRLAQHCIERSGVGVIAMITGNGYFDGLLFRDLRRNWLQTFDEIRLLNLHGSIRRGDTQDDDENVFEILQGVGTAVVSRLNGGGARCIHHAEVRGTREAKYRVLREHTVFSLCTHSIVPRGKRLIFGPQAEENRLLTFSLTDIFGRGNPKKDRNRRWGGGFKTRQDRFTVAFTRSALEDRIAELADDRLSEAELRQRYRLCKTAHFDFAKARSAARAGTLRQAIRTLRYRPFDERPMIWSRTVLCEPQQAISRHFEYPNVALVSSRVVKDDAYRHVSVSTTPVEVISLSNSTSTNAYLFPLYVYTSDPLFVEPDGRPSRTINLSPRFVNALCARWDSIDPEMMFHYIVGILHSNGFRRFFGQALLEDFPVVPIPHKRALFASVSRLGEKISAFHSRYGAILTQHPYPLKGESRLVARGRDYPRWTSERVYINAESYFDGVPARAFAYRCGKYRVLDKWLRDRTGRELSDDEIARYRGVVCAVLGLVDTVPQLDEAIERFGGWPNAFVEKENEEVV
ncbi:MAG: type ISP restriction/modification enzyme, partial [Myxococcota bacterium]|nr:type ISP restriction/modification enzyme [Myxococcota bacterium]